MGRGLQWLGSFCGIGFEFELQARWNDNASLTWELLPFTARKNLYLMSSWGQAKAPHPAQSPYTLFIIIIIIIIASFLIWIEKLLESPLTTMNILLIFHSLTFFFVSILLLFFSFPFFFLGETPLFLLIYFINKCKWIN